MIEFIILTILNVYGLLIMYIDKQKAKRQQWRISEAHLWIVTVIGGGLGIFLGMRIFRHKTKHASFKYGVPLILALQLFLFFYWYV